jgi:N-methylhydantoinase A
MTTLRRIGVDTGGTFTDTVLVDYERNEVIVAKVPSRPAEPQAAILHGVDDVLRMSNAGALAALESVTHGTTIATNAVITGDFARVGMVTTVGFRDVLEIGTQMRPALYDLQQRPRQPMITRDLRLEVGGRIAADGGEIEQLDPVDVEAAIDRLVDDGVEAIAIATLFSFVNDDHERRIHEIAAERAPQVYVGRSSKISNEPREYQRFATAAVNAALAPKIDPYVRRLEAQLTEHASSARLYIMQSNGGVGTADRSVGEHVHQLILSGPAAGVIGGAREAIACGFSNCVTFDVGGTSSDIGIVTDAAPRTSMEMTLPNGVPCRLPHIEVETIGAGGGSIARVDAGGALHVGPQSAGADPGPACYGRGGAEPTVTDAQLLLGRLSPAGLIGGALQLDMNLAEQATQRLADQLGLGLEDAAAGILAVLEENMAGSIRRAAARHGDDLRDFALVCGGGAGPLHAARLMRRLGMPAAVVPVHPGLLSALGLLSAPLRHDHSRSILGVLGVVNDDVVADAFAQLRQRAADSLSSDGVRPAEQRFEATLDLRYLGQEYVLGVPGADGRPLSELAKHFHQLHERTFGHSAPDVSIEIVAARMVGIGVREAPDLPCEMPNHPAEPVATRDVLFEAGDRRLRTAIYCRHELAVGQIIEGPAIVDQLDTTTVIPPEMVATVHHNGALIITNTGERP